MNRLSMVALAVCAGAAIAVAGVVLADASTDSCTAGIGRYQLATSATASGRDDVYETVLDTCTGKVISRSEVSVGKYKD